MKDVKEMVKVAYQALEDKKANDIVVLDISKISPIADYFIICDASNTNQLSALTDEVEEKMHMAGFHQIQREGQKNSPWVLMDYADVIVHIFDHENRGFYNLERIWRDAEEIKDIETL